MHSWCIRISVLALVMLNFTCEASWYWPFVKKKDPSTIKDPTFDEDHQPGMPRQKIRAPEKKEDTISVEHLEKLAKQGNPNAQLALGKIYFEGRAGQKQDYHKALDLFQKAAQKGNGPAMFNIGLCYDGGFGVRKSLENALKWYRKAADVGVPEAQAKVAAIAENTGDFRTAMIYLRMRADGGDAVCMRKLATFILNEIGRASCRERV